VSGVNRAVYDISSTPPATIEWELAVAGGPNLFARLHKWAARQDENFLTDSLAVVLEHLLILAPGVGTQLLRQLTGGFIDVSQGEASAIEVRTQIETGKGRPDLEICTSRRLAWVEVKVDADLGKNQLGNYQALLRNSEVNHGAQTKLVLLTRYPVEVGDQSVLNILWHQVSEWLERAARDQPPMDSVCRFLCEQFIGFLRAKNMAVERVGWELCPGVRALASMLNMLLEAVAACKVPATKNAAWDYVGLKVDGKFWVGFYFTDPDKLCFLTQCKIQREAATKLPVGEVSESTWIPGGSRWGRSAELASEDIHFFARSKVSQMQWLQKFVTETLAMARAIVSPDQPAATEIATPPIAVEAVPLD
jgi:GMP synthase C terminal domain